MNTASTLCALLVPIALLAACGTSDEDTRLKAPDSGTVPETPDAGVAGPVLIGDLDPNVPAAELAAARCAFFERCIPIYYGFNDVDFAGCVQAQTEVQVARFYENKDAIEAGHIAFQADQVGQCVAELGSADCATQLPPGSSCDQVLVGTRTADAGCSIDGECADGWCSRGDASGCGVCESYAPVNQGCENAPCGPEAICLEVGFQTPMLTCISVMAPEGGACGTAQAGLCQGTLACVGSRNTGFSCRRRAGEQDACSTQGRSNPPCDENQGYTCVNSGCVGTTYVERGASCDASNKCRRDSFCDLLTNTCAPLPTVGQRCDVSTRCQVDAWCSGAYCRPLALEGGACEANAQCFGELTCQGATNGPKTCRPAAWARCG